MFYLLSIIGIYIKYLLLLYIKQNLKIILAMVALAASEFYEDRTSVEELIRAITDSTQRIEVIRNNFDTLLNDIYDEMIEKDRNYVYVLSQKFKNQIENLPDYRDLYSILVEIDPKTSKLKTTQDSFTLIEICEEHQIIFDEYLNIQKILISLYK